MINQKRKGNNWERDGAELLSRKIQNSEWKRVPGSGAIGTIFNEPLLVSDIKGNVNGFDKEFRVDAKVGYGGATQLSVKREWLEKIRDEAETNNAIPMLLAKFSGARGKCKTFVVLDTSAFAEIMNYVVKLHDELERIYNEYGI